MSVETATLCSQMLLTHVSLLFSSQHFRTFLAFVDYWHHVEAKLAACRVLSRITSAPLQELSTEKQVTDEEVKTVLAASIKSKKKNKKKKAAKVENGAKDVEAEQ